MAVIPFTGYATKEAADAAKQALIDGLRKGCAPPKHALIHA